MAGIEHKRQERLRSFRDLCATVGFPAQAFQLKIALLGQEREKLIALPRKVRCSCAAVEVGFGGS